MRPRGRAGQSEKGVKEEKLRPIVKSFTEEHTDTTVSFKIWLTDDAAATMTLSHHTDTVALCDTV